MGGSSINDTFPPFPQSILRQWYRLDRLSIMLGLDFMAAQFLISISLPFNTHLFGYLPRSSGSSLERQSQLLRKRYQNSSRPRTNNHEKFVLARLKNTKTSSRHLFSFRLYRVMFATSFKALYQPNDDWMKLYTKT